MKNHFKNILHLLSITIVLIALSGCKKEEEPSWERCADCGLEEISGTYAGKATLHEFNTDSELTNQVTSEEAYLELTGSGSSGIVISAGVFNLYNANISAGWKAGQYTITSPSDGEFFADIWRKGGQIKIKGINKRYASGFNVLISLFDLEVNKTE